VGCGDGLLLAAFVDQGHEGVGTERRGNPARQGLAAPRIRIISGDLADAALPEGSFDLCVYWHVLEHLADPRASLLEARRVLKPGGRLVVAVPNLDSLQARWFGPHWFHLDIPRHLFHFTPGSLSALLARSGFHTERIGHFNLEQKNPYGMLQSALNRLTAGVYEPNFLYEVFKGTRREVRRVDELLQRLAFVLGMPIALCAAVLEAMLGRGGTIEIWATRRGSSP
jgi:SAM-dependent methyltransferase